MSRMFSNTLEVIPTGAPKERSGGSCGFFLSRRLRENLAGVGGCTAEPTGLIALDDRFGWRAPLCVVPSGLDLRETHPTRHSRAGLQVIPSLRD